MEKTKKINSLKLPDRLVTAVDLMRTIRELKMLDDWLNQAAIRSGGAQVAPPKTSSTLEEMSSLNGVSLLEPSHRNQLIKALESFALSVPKIHMAFAVEPSANFLSKMIVWLRTNIHPLIVMEVGLQPALTAGCSVRTSNKLFDMSLRSRFVDSRHFLAESIEEITANDPDSVVAEQAETTTDEVKPAEQAETTPAPEVQLTTNTTVLPTASTEAKAPEVAQPAVNAETQQAPVSIPQTEVTADG